jgi:hypothetical protein
MELFTYAAKADILNKLINEDDLLNIDVLDNNLSESYFRITNHLNHSDRFNSESFKYLYSELMGNENINIELKAIMFSHCEIYLFEKVKLSKRDEYGSQLLDLYEYGVKSKILTYKDKIGVVKFQNIIQFACYLKQFDWAEKFQTNYGELVAKEYVEENRIMSLIKLSFGKANYSELNDIIIHNEFKFFPFKVQSRWFLMSTYFITFDNIDFFESKLTNFTQFFYYNKSKFSNVNFEGGLNLAKIFRAYISKPEFSLEEEVSKYEHITFKTRLPGFIEERKRYVKENGIEL